MAYGGSLGPRGRSRAHGGGAAQRVTRRVVAPQREELGSGVPEAEGRPIRLAPRTSVTSGPPAPASPARPARPGWPDHQPGCWGGPRQVRSSAQGSAPPRPARRRARACAGLAPRASSATLLLEHVTGGDAQRLGDRRVGLAQVADELAALLPDAAVRLLVRSSTAWMTLASTRGAPRGTGAGSENSSPGKCSSRPRTMSAMLRWA